ncbi:hypothetical protein MF672_033195 [Actinomadura sp. ATCC 31491]|uniref:Uncharacterized protein n=1 Tax=Actinomadura luzonensis TaxID=2805427 RepID=A0ABT0G248_9ACTN|nr:hypothetical protein [Actinomadura luzonensis]MCK2218617.1 hypothetical protein [Actinomadura luzonensis]
MSWYDHGLVVVWTASGRREVTPAAAFNEMANPIADLGHGHEVWKQL